MWLPKLARDGERAGVERLAERAAARVEASRLPGPGARRGRAPGRACPRRRRASARAAGRRRRRGTGARPGSTGRMDEHGARAATRPNGTTYATRPKSHAQAVDERRAAGARRPSRGRAGTRGRRRPRTGRARSGRDGAVRAPGRAGARTARRLARGCFVRCLGGLRWGGASCAWVGMRAWTFASPRPFDARLGAALPLPPFSEP